DLVLIDQEMPGRDGMSTYMAIKNEWPKLPTIMITAHGSKHLIKSFLVSGGRDFIEKPIVDFESFDFRIKRVLAELRKEQEAEEKLREAKVREESRKAKDVFLASMSHELRTPLAHIKSFTHRLQKSPRDDSEGSVASLAKIDDAAQSLGLIIENILEITHIENDVQVDMERVSVSNVLNRVGVSVTERIKSGGIPLDISIPLDLPSVKADTQKLVEVFEKLICNSAKYADSGGVFVNARKVSDEIVLSVNDNGKVIPQTIIPDLFEPHRSFDYGVGGYSRIDLSLYKCRCLVESMGGRIWVQSEEGKGTTFFISLKQDDDGKL
ncbi:MAG: HAMP domain-containing histidine kinase, partial [Desulfobulbaceae bacterium]|nr:HAMP domain-containing histidine kinase [Desulfobulbaceae bacterium]